MCTRPQNSTRYTGTTGPVLNLMYDCYSGRVGGVVPGPEEPSDDHEERKKVMEKRLGQSWRRPVGTRAGTFTIYSEATTSGLLSMYASTSSLVSASGTL